MLKQIPKILPALTLCMAMPAMSATAHIAGDTVDFYYDDSTLFGTANVIGDSIFFLPTNFKAESLNGAGVDTANATLNITIHATAGNVIERVVMQESGDYKLNGTGASASVNGMLQVSSLTKNTPPLFLFPYMEQQIFDTGALPNTSGLLEPWSASAEVDLGTIPGWLNDTSVIATAENLLTATTLNHGEQAFVEKKFLGVGLIVNPEPVPVPAAVWLFGSGLLGLVELARRKRKV